MVMPYGIKETGAAAPAPSKVDFDSLWNKALAPLIEELGYQPVRADQDLGALIINEMLERLYFSDLVIADVSIPNGNVYYEIGIRHAAKQTGCVLIGAEWSKTLFDLDQMRQLRYPLPKTDVDEATAKQIKQRLLESIPIMADAKGPVHQVLPGYPDPAKIDSQRATSIQSSLQNFVKLQAEANTLLKLPPEFRETKALVLRDNWIPQDKPILPSVAIEILKLLRDCCLWDDAVALIKKLPKNIQESPFVQEQKALIQSKSGNHLDAIVGLETLIQLSGDSSERQGLLGGRYKKLLREAENKEEKANYLNLAIKHYENGMLLDLNDYYPTCNLPSLYRQRNQPGDNDKASDATRLTYIACERAIQLNSNDEWIRPTLLGLAFQEGDLSKASELADRVIREGAATWKLETTIADLQASVNLHDDSILRERLLEVVEVLESST